MKNIARCLILLLAAGAGLAFSTPAQDLDSAARKAVIDEIARLLDEKYVFPDIGKKCGTHLQTKLAAGAFDPAGTAAALAPLLTEELQSIARDKHLRVFASGARGGAFPPPVAKDLPVSFTSQMSDLEHGFRRVGILPGNIGYLDLLGFVPEAVGRDMAVAAMKFLGGVEALIVDLRDNGGGNPDLIRLISSYFFDRPTHLNSLYWREGNRTQEFWTYEKVDGRRLADIPIFVLTSRRTASGGEEFAYNLKTRKRALIIGETTWGGANPGGAFSLSSGLRIFIPTGRAINPITGTNWEGTGVAPDVPVDRDKAFDIAFEKAKRAADARRGRKSLGLQVVPDRAMDLPRAVWTAAEDAEEPGPLLELRAARLQMVGAGECGPFIGPLAADLDFLEILDVLGDLVDLHFGQASPQIFPQSRFSTDGFLAWWEKGAVLGEKGD
jgi:hypothetical protein